MIERRQPSTPPDLPGYTHQRVLGFGGFADVFLYRQHLPARDVAVKVLLAPRLDDQTRERFVTEANLMAQLSQHPAIVTVHHADFAKDGRPYLVMEYCSRPGVAERYRVERMSVAECLRIGVRLASAVQAAHDVGILHRDIKPANVLTTDFGWPALTDFGIAAATGLAEDAVGMSIPWSPPELLGPAPVGDERSDVYSLAATVYSMLAGRSPFEVVGTGNTAGELVGRIERMPLPKVGRPDVPQELVDILTRAMAKRIEDRHPSALAFAKALQDVEASFGLPITALDRIETFTPRSAVIDDDATRIRILAIESDATRVRPTAVAKPDLPVQEPHIRQLVTPTTSPKRPGRVQFLAVLAVLAIAGAAAVAAGVFRGAGNTPDESIAYSPAVATVEPVVPTPQDLQGTRASDGSSAFTWVNPEPVDGDTYQVAEIGSAGEVIHRVVVESAEIVLAPTSGDVCVQVSILRSDGRLSQQPAAGCAS